MMLACSWPVFATLLVMVNGTAVARGADRAASDDPKAVALTFAKALEAGDADAVVGTAVDGEKNAKAITTVVRANAAMQRLRKASVERFGEAGAAVAGTFDPHDTLADKVANAHREGGVAVSDAERAAIKEIAGALGAAAPADQ